MSLPYTRLAPLAALVLALPLAPSATADGKLAIKVGRIITMHGPDITNGAILIENGRITAIGANLELPWDAVVIDQPKMVAFPGFVEAPPRAAWTERTRTSTSRRSSTCATRSNPVASTRDALRWGLTTLNVQQGQDT